MLRCYGHGVRLRISSEALSAPPPVKASCASIETLVLGHGSARARARLDAAAYLRQRFSIISSETGELFCQLSLDSRHHLHPELNLRFDSLSKWAATERVTL